VYIKCILQICIQCICTYILKSNNGTHYMSFHFFIITSYYHQYTWPSFIHISTSLLLYIIVVQSYHAISLSFCVTCQYNIPYHVMDIIEKWHYSYSTNILSYPILSCTFIHILIGNSYKLLIAAHTHSTRQT
jgi:hypothetical protein